MSASGYDYEVEGEGYSELLMEGAWERQDGSLKEGSPSKGAA